MTSNDVSQLPPELTRSGRLDSQWYFGFPNAQERKEIFDIYLKKANLELDNKIYMFLVSATQNYTGAEIKDIVRNLVVKSFFRQKDSGKEPERTITADDARNSINSVIPIYKSSKEKIEKFQSFVQDRYRIASLSA